MRKKIRVAGWLQGATAKSREVSPIDNSYDTNPGIKNRGETEETLMNKSIV